jgi:uncharacterized protein YjbI with pentapeptide repeats
MIEIKHRFTGNVLFACDAGNLKEAVVKAVKGGADLGGAYLRGADLRGADLRDAYLRDAYLGGADLRDADLRDAYLGGADLRDADLRDAYLGGAYLRDAYLGGADLGGAYLRGEKIAIRPLSITGLYWDVLITESYMEIGCQRHEHAEWKKFDYEAISDMASNASEFWKQNKTWLLAACKAHRAESLAYRKAHPEIEEKEAA